MDDYLNMLNERDGGIGGVKINVEECETGYDTKKGVECYEQVKSKHPVVINPYSTGITLPLIPKAAVDKIPILSMAYGLSASADGNDFPWIFNPPATYWDGVSMFIRYIGGKEGGLDKLKGKKIGFIYLDAPYGNEPIPLLAGAGQGLRLRTQALSGAGRGNAEPVVAVAQHSPRSSELDDHVGLGRHESDRGQGSRQERLSRWITSIGIGGPAAMTTRVRRGPAAKGYLSLNFDAVGTNFPVIKDIQKYVIDKGKSQTREGPASARTSTIAASSTRSIIAEAIRNAQKLTGKKVDRPAPTCVAVWRR